MAKRRRKKVKNRNPIARVVKTIRPQRVPDKRRREIEIRDIGELRNVLIIKEPD